jgi:hypothetical protein
LCLCACFVPTIPQEVDSTTRRSVRGRQHEDGARGCDAATMPIFICEACNETLKRNKVQQHRYGCRNCWVMSCMDCNQRFEGDDFLGHTTCVTEAERYQGHLYVHKENKGEVKQQAWMGNVQEKLDRAGPAISGAVRSYMQRLLAYDNVPRKRAKFINFAKNSLNLKADRDGIAEKLWDIIGAAPEPAPTLAPAPAPEPAPAQSSAPAPAEPPASAAVHAPAGSAEKEARKAAKKAAKAAKKAADADDAHAAPGASGGAKRKAGEPAAEAAASASAAVGSSGGREKRAKGEEAEKGGGKPIKWKKMITKELETCGGRMHLKELRKAVVAEAQAHPSHGERKAAALKEEFDEVLPTFHKYRVEGSQVILVKNEA